MSKKDSANNARKYVEERYHKGEYSVEWILDQWEKSMRAIYRADRFYKKFERYIDPIDLGVEGLSKSVRFDYDFNFSAVMYDILTEKDVMPEYMWLWQKKESEQNE
tara:strand:- start:311 stop:628 length:318 start_codon:yes stop_codon:yes gene_type:complete